MANNQKNFTCQCDVQAVVMEHVCVLGLKCCRFGEHLAEGAARGHWPQLSHSQHQQLPRSWPEGCAAELWLCLSWQFQVMLTLPLRGSASSN